MTKDEIMTRCRRVAITIESNKIFGEQNSPYEWVSAFRNRQLAEENLKRNDDGVTVSQNGQRVCEFYLVPATFID